MNSPKAMSQVMSSPYQSPYLGRDPYHTNNPHYQEHTPQQCVKQQHHASTQPLHDMPATNAAQTVSAAEAQAEIERLTQRIEQLQQPQASPRFQQLSAAAMPERNGSYQDLQSKYDSEYSDALNPAEPPAYTSSLTKNEASLSQASSSPSMKELSSLNSVPRAPTSDFHARLSRLDRPIAIPATNAKLGSPFLRAFAPVLTSYALPKEAFLQFIDNLNRVAVASPPLQVLGLAGTIVSFVPLATAAIVGNAVSFAAQAGTVAVSKGGTELYLRQANKDIFAPRGLKVDIAKVDAIAKIADIPILDNQGKIDKNSRLLEDLGDLDAQSIRTMSGQERRLGALSHWIAPLEVTPLPEIERQSNPLSRLNQAVSERQRTKGEKKLIEDREKAHKKVSKDGARAERDCEKEMRKLEKEKGKAMRKKDGRELEKELKKVERQKQKVEIDYQKEIGKLVKEDKEEKAMRKILWLVIRNLEE